MASQLSNFKKTRVRPQTANPTTESVSRLIHKSTHLESQVAITQKIGESPTKASDARSQGAKSVGGRSAAKSHGARTPEVTSPAQPRKLSERRSTV